MPRFKPENGKLGHYLMPTLPQVGSNTRQRTTRGDQIGSLV